MADFNISDIRANGNPQRAYEWEVKIIGVPTPVGWDHTTQDILVQRAQTVSLPEDALEVVTINYRSSVAEFFGRDASAHTASITFFEAEGEGTRGFFLDWMNTMRNHYNGESKKKGTESYMASVAIRKLFTDGTTADTVVLTPAFPSSVGEMSLDYSSSEAATFDVTFAYDEQLHNDSLFDDFKISIQP